MKKTCSEITAPARSDWGSALKRTKVECSGRLPLAGFERLLSMPAAQFGLAKSALRPAAAEDGRLLPGRRGDFQALAAPPSACIRMIPKSIRREQPMRGRVFNNPTFRIEFFLVDVAPWNI